MIKLKDTYPLYLNNKAAQPNADLEVTDKFTGEVAFRTALATPDVIDAAIAGAVRAAEPMARLASYEKRDVLDHCVRRFTERQDELAYALCVEAGKPIADSEGEVGRLIDTFRIAAEEATRNYGEIQPLDISPRAKGYMGMWKRVPIGPCSFISPFNFPLNLAAHKIAPAIAVGCPFVMKPASMTPLGAIIMGEVLAECDVLPEGAFSILPAARAGSDLFTTDERLKLLSFTGSPGVGWELKAKAGKKKVVLELGGNAAVVVDKDADLEHALARIIFGGYYQSGQSCIHVQRVIIHAEIYETFRDMLAARVRTLISGDPKQRDTFIGPMISVREAQRLKSWIDDAVAGGARLLAGGGCEGNMLEATLLEGCTRDMAVYTEEAFGPVVILSQFTDWDAALAEVNDSKFGLQAGLFTSDLHKVLEAWDVLDVGGIVVNDVSSYRVDNMPYGGVKDSGLGREGIRFAMEDMSEIRNMVIRRQ
ncbi:Acyl-CoA reductase or other NAD-dependent aldehyde dehydrogenase [Novosphingobium lubricantis]|jgi:acyl-CoA reductase-like NAD-dependent aldehyde dehydrogenase